MRKPATDITIEMLMLHTPASATILNKNDKKYRQLNNIPSTNEGTFASMKTVLLFEPGEKWNYGINIDWIAKIIENVRGERLGAVMKKEIFEPLGMDDIGYQITPSMKERLATVHIRRKDGSIKPLPNVIFPQQAEMDMGGHGLYASIGEYMKFIRMLLNDGGPVLKPETVAKMAQNGIGNKKIGKWISSDPKASNNGDFFPGVKKSWGYTFLINEEPLPTGRPAGQLMWSGLANLYYWIDRKTGIGGFWAAQLKPFQDPAAYLGYLEFETAVYTLLKKYR